MRRGNMNLGTLKGTNISVILENLATLIEERPERKIHARI